MEASFGTCIRHWSSRGRLPALDVGRLALRCLAAQRNAPWCTISRVLGKTKCIMTLHPPPGVNCTHLNSVLLRHCQYRSAVP
mmetsp:Transcript_23945/g.39614  ORF Transcript_23945/g.39614 Transcript_23945/m.39614 type:complete len:82 (+) Transcript_23945:445-690(+)